MFEIIGRLSPQSKRTTNLRFNILNLHRQLGIQIGKARIVLEKAMAPHSSTLAWKIPWMEEPGRLQSIGLLRVGHDWTTSLSLFTFMHWRRKWQPTPVLECLENPRDGGAWWAAVYGVSQSRTWLKWLSSSRIVLMGAVIKKIKQYIVFLLYSINLFWVEENKNLSNCWI